ncbi:MAG: PQQ-binding-like beta-propeller repeat protein [Planctomycetales bacterium]|nr:PQQ-binding-like beta-propeller repeat protein [Planctomycetales bacterium]
MLFTACGWLCATATADDWPEFRGPSGQGVATATALPLELNVDQAAWKCAIPGRGWSSPSVSHGRVFVTTAVESEDDKSLSLRLVCVSATSGELLFDKELFRHEAVKIHKKNSHASPTPIVRDGVVYAHFGPHGTAAVTVAGEPVWSNDQLNYSPVHGNGGSPILVEDLLIFSADGAANPEIVALSIHDGSVKWRTPRGTEAKKKFSFTTPLAIPAAGGAMLAISPGSDRLSAVDCRTGAEAWFVNYTGYSVIPRPVHGHGLVFFSTSYDSPQVMAVAVGGKGDVTDSHVRWTLDKGAPHTPSMILRGDELYMVSDRGIASCVDARTGELHWRERLGGNFSASPTLAGDRIYFFSEEGKCSVVAADKQYKLLASSDLKEPTLASPAVLDRALIVRTSEHLYRFE